MDVNTEYTYIYGLYDPRDPKSPRYIGKADNPQKRLLQHIGRNKLSRRSKRGTWLKEMSGIGLSPIMCVLEQVPKALWQNAEREHIKRALDAGCCLVNATPGGEGVVNWTDLLRQKISEGLKGKAKSPEHRKSMSMVRIGKPRSEEAERKTSETMRGKKFTKEHCERISESMKGKQLWLGKTHSKETKERITRGLKEYYKTHPGAGTGCPMSQKTRDRLRESKLGKARPDYVKRKMSDSRKAMYQERPELKVALSNRMAKPYPSFINTKSGEIIPAGVNLTALCKEMGLNQGDMRMVAAGKTNQHRGWMVNGGQDGFSDISQ